METKYRVPLPNGVQLSRSCYRSCITVNGRSVFIGYHHSIPDAVAARDKAIEIRDRHQREGLPVTIAQLRELPEGSVQSSLGALVDLFAPHADPERAARYAHNRKKMLMRRWRDWAPENLEVAKAVIELAEKRIGEASTPPKPDGKCPMCGRGQRTPEQALAEYAYEPETVALMQVDPAAPPIVLSEAYPAGADGQPLPWEQWMKEYAEELKSRGDTEQHIHNAVWRIKQIIGVCGPEPLNRQAIVRAVAAIVSKGRSYRTANGHLVGTRSFLKWLCDDQKLPFNVARGIRLYKAQKDKRHRRSAFTNEQLSTLIQTTYASRIPWSDARIEGPDRAALYFAAAATGLRAGTLKVIRIEQFELNPPPGRAAYVRVRASQLKDCEDLTVPIAPDAAEYLRSYFAGKPADAHAFKFPGNYNTVRMLRRDLRDAGITYCKETTLANGMTARSEVLDFHSLRKTFGTRCAQAGVGLAVLQKWMGHSDPKLTSNIYLDAGLGDDPAVVGQIPAILPRVGGA